MATEMQKRAVAGTLENLGRERPLSKQEILKNAGYSPAVAKNPDIVLESKGFLELIDFYLPEDKLLKALNDDIEGKPFNRKAELELAFKLRGRLKETESPRNLNVFVFNDEQQRRIATRILNGSPTST